VRRLTLGEKRYILVQMNRAARRGDIFGYGHWWHALGMAVGATGLTGALLDQELNRWQEETGVELFGIEQARFSCDNPFEQLEEYERLKERVSDDG
jgi:hypothetical protein